MTLPGTLLRSLAGIVGEPHVLTGEATAGSPWTGPAVSGGIRLRDTVTALAGLGGLDELHALARQAVREVPGLVSAERGS